jgi:hypothetical protein
VTATSWRRLLRALVAVLLLIAGTAGCSSDDPTVHRFVIPAGSGARADAGEVLLDVFPASLAARVGDRIVIVNEDDRTHVVGPFTVRENETLDYRFAEPGRYQGDCTVHGDGHAAVIEVT